MLTNRLSRAGCCGLGGDGSGEGVIAGVCFRLVWVACTRGGWACASVRGCLIGGVGCAQWLGVSRFVSSWSLEEEIT